MLQILKNTVRGKKALQGFFERAHQYSLSGMNIGSGADFLQSGEKFALEYVKQTLLASSATPIIFDVGANIGNYSKEIARTFSDRDVTIHAFEPSQQTFTSLTQNCHTIPQFFAQNIALSDSEGTITLYTDKQLSGLASLNKRRLDHFEIPFNQSEVVTMTTLDAFCHNHTINKIDFLKLDVEGHELAVLKGAHSMLTQGNITCIQFEFGGANIDSRTFFQDFFYLLNPSYTIYRILTDGLQEISHYNERYEIFLATNFLAVKRQATQ